MDSLPRLGNLLPGWRPGGWRGHNCQRSSEPRSREQPRRMWRPFHCRGPRSSLPGSGSERSSRDRKNIWTHFSLSWFHYVFPCLAISPSKKSHMYSPFAIASSSCTAPSLCMFPRKGVGKKLQQLLGWIIVEWSLFLVHVQKMYKIRPIWNEGPSSLALPGTSLTIPPAEIEVRHQGPTSSGWI